jgi:hypothetical protein
MKRKIKKDENELEEFILACCFDSSLFLLPLSHLFHFYIPPYIYRTYAVG